MDGSDGLTSYDPYLETEYNNRRKVPEHPGIMGGWTRDAAAFRDAHPHAEHDLSYGASERQVLDVFWPAATRDAPLALFIHGGYWQALDKSWFSHLARGFVARGIALAVPSYDLCPNVTLDVLTDEVRRAAAFLMARHARDLHATGHSAGGHLAAMLLATDWAALGFPKTRVAGACAISGLFDLAPLVSTSVNNALGLDLSEAARLSPVNLPAPGLPLRAVLGEHEGAEYTRQSIAIAKAWNGVWGVIPGANHFTAIAPLTDPGSDLMSTIVADMGR
jgi:arylformamidase